MKFLITGGAGFIGSTIASAAIDHGHTPVILDSLVTGRREFVTGRDFYEGDIADADLVNRIFDEHPDLEAVVHCAALIVVPDSVADPIGYYDANVSKTLRFIDTAIARGLTRLIFSSSASMYEPSDDFSVDESAALNPVSPYARTKAVVEGMLSDISAATDLRVMSLRYFNPIGADPRMRTGLQIELPSHALGKLILAKRAGSAFLITGDDYPTRDGTGIRDYVHVWDLASAHLAALESFDDSMGADGYQVINLGTGTGTTVAELVAAFERVTGEPMPVTSAPRRPGDAVGAFTRSSKAEELLAWTPQLSIDQGIADSLTWFDQRGSILPDLA